MGLGEANEEKRMHHKLEGGAGKELGSAGVKPPPLQGGLECAEQQSWSHFPGSPMPVGHWCGLA